MRKVDITGKTFGRLTAINPGVPRKWICRCECGTEVEVALCSLRGGYTKSCGCLAKECKSASAKKRFVKDLNGEIFGKLIVISRNYIKQKEMNNNCAYWNCNCQCGSETVALGSSLRRGTKKSCGCLSKELLKSRNNTRKPKGESTFNGLFYHYGYNANRRGLDFKLTASEFRALIEKNCYYCGCDPSNCYKSRYDKGDLVYQGIDRIKNEIGYVPDNCVPCCGQCNWAKGNLTIQEFLEWARRIVRNLGGNGG